MTKFINPKSFNNQNIEGYLITPIPSKHFVVWDGKNFRRKDGSLFSGLTEDFTFDLPENIPILGWISREGRDIPDQKDKLIEWKSVTFFGFDIPEMAGTVEERIEFLENLWYRCRNYYFKPANVLSKDQAKLNKKPSLLRKLGSKWKENDWLFEI